MVRHSCVRLLAALLILLCGTRVFAAEEGSPDLLPGAPIPVLAGETALFPVDVQTVTEGGTRQIVKTYILAPEQNPALIPHEDFKRDGWLYTLTDITETRNAETDKRNHAETVEIDTDTKDLNAIISLLEPTLEYQSEDGFSGVLALDLTTVNCEAAGYRNSSYTVTATREYPNLSANDLSLIPKSITDSGQTLKLEDVNWETQTSATVGYEQIPSSYCAVAKYTASASRSVATGYVTTAVYTGEITKAVIGNTIYTVYFDGREINPAPKPTSTPKPKPTPTPTPEPTPAPEPEPAGNSTLTPIIIAAVILVALAGAAWFFFMRRNVKVYRDDFRVLAAKDRISAKNPVIDLSPLEGNSFGIELDKFTAKSMDGKTIEVRHKSGGLKHQIAYEGNAYRMEADFGAGNIKANYK